MTDKDPRLEKIKADLASRKQAEQKSESIHSKKFEDTESMSTGLRAGAELITSIAAGGLIGYLLDQWLSTTPLFLIAMLILGVITGFVNVWRTTQGIGHAVGYKDANKTRKK
jgi:ATP synthase protein I